MLLPVLFAAGLAGCTGVSETDCVGGNWEEIGYKAGTNGDPAERSAGHAVECEKYGATVDEAAWDKGWQRGIEEYCSANHAIQIGLRGGKDSGVCPEGLAVTFSSNWRQGRMVYEQRQRVQQLEQRRNQLDSAYRSAMDDQQRYEIRNQLMQVDEWLRNERFRLAQAEAQLTAYQNSIR
jgi:hypothetical protein